MADLILRELSAASGSAGGACGSPGGAGLVEGVITELKLLIAQLDQFELHPEAAADEGHATPPVNLTAMAEQDSVS